jgi:hypothetical protein
MKPFNKDATQIVPDNASPVLKTKLNVKVEANFPFTINSTDDWTVNMTLLELSS